MLAAVTPLPVIGVPVPLKYLDGMDSLLSIVQMPAGVPVATVAIGNARNAGLLAVRILAAADQALRRRMVQFQDQLRQAAEAKGEAVRDAARAIRPSRTGSPGPRCRSAYASWPARRPASRPPREPGRPTRTFASGDGALPAGMTGSAPVADGLVGAYRSRPAIPPRTTWRQAVLGGGPVPVGRALSIRPSPVWSTTVSIHIPSALVRWIRSIRQICMSWISQVNRTSSPPPAARPAWGCGVAGAGPRRPQPPVRHTRSRRTYAARACCRAGLTISTLVGPPA